MSLVASTPAALPEACPCRRRPATDGTHVAPAGRCAPARCVAVLGIVYGDIGTSPLYAFKASLDHFTSQGVAEFEILGILSLIFWSLIFVVTIKYVALVMSADNKGEGGILALMALAMRAATDGRGKAAFATVGIVGACLFFGDGVITPAVSVLSAIEGLEVSAPDLQPYVVPIACAVIVGLFAVQYRGTGRVGRIFGPVMAVWFAVIGMLGAIQICAEPAVLYALSPHHLVLFCMRHGWLAFVSLGLRGAGRHRGGSAVCRYGAFRRVPDPLGLDGLRAALPGAQLFRPGRADPAHPIGHRQPVLPDGPGQPAAAARRARHRRHRDRQPGPDLRRLLHCPAVHADELPAAHDRHPHQHHGGGTDLRSADQHRPVHRRVVAGSGLPQQRRADLRLRHRRHRHVHLHLHPGRCSPSAGSSAGPARWPWACSASSS